MNEEVVIINIDGIGYILPRNPNKTTIHFCVKHNCPFWDTCPICGYDDMAINPSRRDRK
jgi:hypothetical protein